MPRNTTLNRTQDRLASFLAVSATEVLFYSTAAAVQKGRARTPAA